MPNPLNEHNGNAMEMLADEYVRERLGSLVKKRARDSVNYLRRTDQLYHRVPRQLKDELEQVGWLAACEWCSDKDDGVIYRICQIRPGTERKDPIVGELYQRIYKTMNSFLFKDWNDRWIELRQSEGLAEVMQSLECGDM